jgi:hypothetical protein
MPLAKRCAAALNWMPGARNCSAGPSLARVSSRRRLISPLSGCPRRPWGRARRPRLSHSLLLALLLCLSNPASARTADTGGDERRVDITSDFLELGFAGTVEITETTSECLYRIPTLSIRFLKLEGRLTKAIYLSQFQVVAVGVRGGDQYGLLERRYPLVASLNGPGSEVNVRDITFAVSKSILQDAEYIGFGVAGQMVLKDDGRFDALGPAGKAHALGPWHVLWPISAPSNIIRKTTDAYGEHGVRVYRAPRDPNDLCSSAKIR